MVKTLHAALPLQGAALRCLSPKTPEQVAIHYGYLQNQGVSSQEADMVVAEIQRLHNAGYGYCDMVTVFYINIYIHPG